jgi:ABC-type Fe3+-hydroxamate transport system substrate-binding protein
MAFAFLTMSFVLGALIFLVSGVFCYRLGLEKGRQAREASVKEWVERVAAEVRAKENELEQKATKAIEAGGSGNAGAAGPDSMSDADFLKMFGYPKPVRKP